MSFTRTRLNNLLEHAGLATSRLHEPEELSFERKALDSALSTLAPVQAPPDLSLRIRLALSHERVRAERRLLGRLQHRWVLFRENSLRPVALHVAVAAVAVIAITGGMLMLGAVTPQQTVQAHDVPLAGFSAPRYLYSIAGEQPVGGTSDQPLVVEADIDSSGRVYDYRILSGMLDARSDAALRQRMLTGVFEPGEVFGEAVRGHVVLTFADIVVHG